MCNAGTLSHPTFTCRLSMHGGKNTDQDHSLKCLSQHINKKEDVHDVIAHPKKLLQLTNLSALSFNTNYFVSSSDAREQLKHANIAALCNSV